MIAYVANQSGKDQKILAKRCYNMECIDIDLKSGKTLSRKMKMHK